MKTRDILFSFSEDHVRKELNNLFNRQFKKDFPAWPATLGGEDVEDQAMIDDIVRESISLQTRTEFIMRGSFTIAVVRAKHKGKFYEALGIAVKSRKDTNNRDRGIQIAEGRARKALELKIRGHAITKRYMG